MYEHFCSCLVLPRMGCWGWGGKGHFVLHALIQVASWQHVGSSRHSNLKFFCECFCACWTKPAILSSSITQHLSINKLHFGTNKRFRMDFCHPPSSKLKGCEHMQRLCCSFLVLYDGTFNCNKSAIDGKWVTDWTGSTAAVQGHSTRTTHYFKLPPMRRIYRICQDGALSLTPHLSVSSQRPSLFSLRIAFPN